jgi:long-chain acyl-CoA synthetase
MPEFKELKMKKAIKISALLIFITLSYQCKQKGESAKENAIQTSKVKNMSTLNVTSIEDVKALDDEAKRQLGENIGVQAYIYSIPIVREMLFRNKFSRMVADANTANKPFFSENGKGGVHLNEFVHLRILTNHYFDTVETKATDTAVIVYTSGTTGKPKGAELSHSNLIQNTILSESLYNCSKDDTMLIVLPLFHIFAMTVLMNAALYKGATSILLPRFDAGAVLDSLDKHKITVFAGVPTMYWGLNSYLDANDFDISTIKSNLKMCLSGGASLPVTVLEKFEERFDVLILEGFGMSEGSPVVTFNQLDIGRKPGSVGTPVWGVQVKLVDTDGNEVVQGEKGELLYKGHNVMKGYFNNPKATAKTIQNGWLYSGDIAIKDEDGFYFIVDRTKDMIIRGGLNIYPREVETVMMKHPDVSMAAVIGIPDEEMGEEVKAFVVLKENTSATEEELSQFTKDNIAAYKYPRVLEIIKALPMSATGKILKKELRKL